MTQRQLWPMHKKNQSKYCLWCETERIYRTNAYTIGHPPINTLPGQAPTEDRWMIRYLQLWKLNLKVESWSFHTVRAKVEKLKVEKLKQKLKVESWKVETKVESWKLKIECGNQPAARQSASQQPASQPASKQPASQSAASQPASQPASSPKTLLSSESLEPEGFVRENQQQSTV